MRPSFCLWATGAALCLLACGDDGTDGTEGTGGGAGATSTTASGSGTPGTTSSSSSVGGAGTGGEGAGGTGGAGGEGPGGGSGTGGEGGGPDVTPPQTTFERAPADGQSNGLASAFELSCNEVACTFECSFGGEAFAPCDTTFAFDPLAPGDYSLAVRATDAAGNVEDPPAAHAWSLVFGWRDVAASTDAACAISGDNQLYCWGSDDEGSLGDGPGGPGYVLRPTRVDDATDWDAVSSGSEALCAHKTTGELFCWGEGYALGLVDAADTPTLLADDLDGIEASYDFACGLDSTGAVLCMGYGADGVLGDGDLQDHYVEQPTPIDSESYVDVGVGDRHACAVRADGQLLCWGWQPTALDPVAVPASVDGATDWARVAVGEAHTCAVKATGTLFCWGENGSGQLGIPGTEAVEPTQVGADDDWIDVFASGYTSCAVRGDGSTSCWGANDAGQLGSPLVPLARVDEPTPLAPALQKVSGRGDFACGVTTDGFVRCWGDNYQGKLGRAVDDVQASMVRIDDGFESIGLVDGGGGCGIRSGELACWGSARSNGLPAGFVAPIPTPVSADTDWTDVTVSMVHAGHACGIRDEALYCWGTNDYGQLGDGSTTSSAGPVAVAPVSGVTGWSHVSAGAYATCAVSTSGDLYCWGYNEYGQLGVGSPNLTELVPQQVEGSGWDTVDMGFFRVAARRTDGTFWRWGVNEGTTPSQLPGTDWVVVGATGFGECGIRTNGTLHCTQQGIAGAYPAGSATDWAQIVGPGYPWCALNTAGAVGCFVSASQTSFNASPAIESGDGWLSLEAPGSLACGLRAGNERHCRGPRRLGSLGDGFDERVPTLVVDP